MKYIYFVLFLCGSIWPSSSDLNLASVDQFGVIEMKGRPLLSPDLIAVKVGGKIKIHGQVMNDLDHPVDVLVGVVCYDENGREIDVISVCPIAGTEAVLARDCGPEDDVIYVWDASSWVVGDSYVAFDVKRGWSDIPNRRCSGGRIGSLQKKDDLWEVQLRGACGGDYPRGTSLRLHRDGNTYIYLLVKKVNPGAGWVDVEGVAEMGNAMVSAPFESNFLRPGTAYVKMIVIGNPSNRLKVRGMTLSVE